MSILEQLYLANGSLIKMRRAILRDRRWSPEDWYRAWDTTDLASQCEQASIHWLADRR